MTKLDLVKGFLLKNNWISNTNDMDLLQEEWEIYLTTMVEDGEINEYDSGVNFYLQKDDIDKLIDPD